MLYKAKKALRSHKFYDIYINNVKINKANKIKSLAIKMDKMHSLKSRINEYIREHHTNFTHSKELRRFKPLKKQNICECRYYQSV